MKSRNLLFLACGLGLSSLGYAQQPSTTSLVSNANNSTTEKLGIGAPADSVYLLTINQQHTKRFGEHNFLQLINSNNFKLLDITGSTYGTNGLLNITMYQYDKSRSLVLNNNGASDFFKGLRIGSPQEKADFNVYGRLHINSNDCKNDINIASKYENSVQITDTCANRGTTFLIKHNSKSKRIFAIENDSAKTMFQITSNGTVVAKNIFAENIKADKTALSKKWPDYVFAKSYKLRSISDVEQFIDKNGHLPDVPSQNDVAKNGIELGDMNAILLKKVEELTLYMIQLQKQNDLLQKSVDQMKAKQ